MTKSLARSLVVALLFATFAVATAPALAQEDAAPAASDLLLILDASGSMWGQIGGENKIVIARRALRELLGDLPADAEIGLIAYGHRREADCADIETIAAIGAMPGATIADRVDAINPRGRTPIHDSVQSALAQVQERDTPTTIVLLSDGLETCSGNACEAVRLAREAGAPFVLHVIGFGLGDEDASSLECIAQAGGGTYMDADNAEGLAAALSYVAYAAPEIPPGRLSVKGVADGQLTDVSVSVMPLDKDEVVAGGRTYTDPATNPRVLALPAGIYRVKAQGVRFQGEPIQWFRDVVITEDGAPVELVADFSTGEIAVDVTRNGVLSDATVNFLLAGTKTSAAAGRTYRSAESNPKVQRLTAGTYDVEISSVEIANKPTRRWEGVVVEPGGRVELAHEFVSGTLRIGAVRAGELVDATVSIRDAETREAVDGSRTYTAATSNPATFVLSPGRYTVELRGVRLQGDPRETFEITVAAGETVERMVEL